LARPVRQRRAWSEACEAALEDQLGVASIDALRRAAEVGRFCSIRGFETKVERTSDPGISELVMVLVPMSRFAIDLS